ncbi:MAG: DUF1461 domain-containing protein [Nanoarchaeota archaeon]|nr:DUF1461 domain-containing protein [Nanoarchaeota archaeon]MBU1270239.1 DUF1461 domain-containing protein [Nanoarchaeota archaeon]MBU1604811.1 DUF1461 domain-containing protein [Nanoarchaeota archaeon]MBU2442837.1 DUF1461 domain-containing protein [Nanoarchaeota archaeon]
MVSNRKSHKEILFKKERLEKTLFIGAVIFLAVLVLILPLRMIIFNNNYYYQQFEKNDVYEKINETNAKTVLDNLLLFFQDKQELKYFEENEKSHLKDVKVLLNKFFFTLDLSLILVLCFFAALIFVEREQFLDNFFKILFLGGLVSFSLIILIFLASLNFSMTFQGFHEVFFPQGNYTFSEVSLLITLFPAAFFKDFLLKMLLVALSISMGFMVPQLLLNKFK